MSFRVACLSKARTVIESTDLVECDILVHTEWISIGEGCTGGRCSICAYEHESDIPASPILPRFEGVPAVAVAKSPGSNPDPADMAPAPSRAASPKFFLGVRKGGASESCA